MSRGRGGIIAGTLPAWTTTSTSGAFTLREAQELRAANTWPRGPVAPTSLTAAPGSNQLALNWTAPATTYGTITNYLVEYTPSGGSPQYVLTGSTSTSYTLTGLTNGTEYTVRVAAVNFTAGDYSHARTSTPVGQAINVSPLALTAEVGDYWTFSLQEFPWTGGGIASDKLTASCGSLGCANLKGRGQPGRRLGSITFPTFTAQVSGTLYIEVYSNPEMGKWGPTGNWAYPEWNVASYNKNGLWGGRDPFTGQPGIPWAGPAVNNPNGFSRRGINVVSGDIVWFGNLDSRLPVSVWIE